MASRFAGRSVRPCPSPAADRSCCHGSWRSPPISCFADYLPLGSQILIMILFALSLDLVLGYAGIVTLGHAAFFGVGAYAAGIYAVHVSRRAVVRPAGRGGRRRRRRPGIRRHHPAHHRPDLAHADAGGRPRCCRRPRTMPASSPAAMTDCKASRSIRSSARSASTCSAAPPIFIAWSCCSSCWLFVRRLVHAPFGHSLVGIRENVVRMHAIGAPVRRRLLTAYTISAALAGIAGALAHPNHAVRRAERAEFRTLRRDRHHAGARRCRPVVRRVRRRRAVHDRAGPACRDAIRSSGISGSACCWC